MVVAVVPLANLLLWLAAPPAAGAGATQRLVTEAVGSTAVLLLATALVLSTRARFLEPHFGGLDKLYRAHRSAGLAGFLLLAGHVAIAPWDLPPGGAVPPGLLAFAGMLVLVVLTFGPRLPVLRRLFGISYRSWRRGHRLIGVFFMMSVAHALLVDPLAAGSPVLLAVLLAAYVTGTLAYLYTLLLAWLVRPTYRYAVTAVRQLNRSTVEISLRPRRRRRLAFHAGQFVFVLFRRRGLREPHPFTVSSPPTEDQLRLTIKAAGDFTGALRDALEPGVRARVEGGYGMLDYRTGRRSQLWVAGGIGVTPFLSWLRDLDRDPDYLVDFFYTVRADEDALFWDEILAAARRDGRVRAHLHVSSRDGQLTPARVAAATQGPLRDRDAYLCGPAPMIRSFRRGLRRAGMPAGSIHFEEFSFR